MYTACIFDDTLSPSQLYQACLWITISSSSRSVAAMSIIHDVMLAQSENLSLKVIFVDSGNEMLWRSVMLTRHNCGHWSYSTMGFVVQLDCDSTYSLRNFRDFTWYPPHTILGQNFSKVGAHGVWTSIPYWLTPSCKHDRQRTLSKKKLGPIDSRVRHCSETWG